MNQLKGIESIAIGATSCSDTIHPGKALIRADPSRLRRVTERSLSGRAATYRLCPGRMARLQMAGG